MKAMSLMGGAAGALITGWIIVSHTAAANAAVSAGDAAKLKTTLTPLGGEKAGNADGTIPAWNGGMTSPLPGFVNGGRRDIDPFAGEKPLFTISNKNMDQYKDRLSEGTVAMMTRYPGEYVLNVYPSHRTMAAGQWVYDNTFTNATRAKLVNNAPSGAYGGIPFPIPQSGEETIWNHLLNVHPVGWHEATRNYVLTADGKRVMVTEMDITKWMPYYDKKGSLETFDASGRDYHAFVLKNDGPPIRAGEGVVQIYNFDNDETRAWVYLTGQRRIRKLPNPCCDTPFPPSSGILSFDELYIFSGRTDRFDWELVGKKEMYIPYNSNKILIPTSDDEVVSSRFLNPEHVRWELHRVWVVEAKMKPGNRHVSPRSRYYLDEDSWIGVLGERWASDGSLAKSLINVPSIAPDIPAILTTDFGFYDLSSGAGFIAGVYNYSPEHWKIVDTYTAKDFTPEKLAGEGVR